MEQKAEEACAKYAASLGLESTCEAAVETYGPVVVNRATAFLADADKVRAELHMCPPVDEAREGSNRRNPVKLARRRARRRGARKPTGLGRRAMKRMTTKTKTMKRSSGMWRIRLRIFRASTRGARVDHRCNHTRARVPRERRGRRDRCDAEGAHEMRRDERGARRQPTRLGRSRIILPREV